MRTVYFKELLHSAVLFHEYKELVPGANRACRGMAMMKRTIK